MGTPVEHLTAAPVSGRVVDDALWGDLVARAGGTSPADVRPPWVQTLQAVAALAAERPQADARPATAPGSEGSPFEPLLRPFILHGRACVRARLRNCDAAGADAVRLGPGAQADLERQLLRRLAELSGPALQARLAGYRAARQTSLDRLLSRAGRSLDADPLVAEFVAAEGRDGPLALWARFPVLARLQAQVVQDWVEGTVELHERLAADGALVRRLLGGDSLGAVAAVETDLSDPHRHARTVSILSFADGRRLVYKPKSLGMDAGFAQLVEWLNGEGLPLELRHLRVLDRATHGWSEYVPAVPCAGAAEERRYARRCGMLLALAHVLDITDLHLENVVSSGEHPVLIDLETMMASRLPTLLVDEPLRDAAALIKEQLDESVLRTSMLPQWQVDHRGAPMDVSALAPSPAGAAGPASGSPPDAAVTAHFDELVEGFTETYRVLRRRRDFLAGGDGPVAGLHSHEARFLARDTRTYAAVIRESQSPACMADARRRSATVRRLAAAIDRNPGNGVIAAIVGSEIAAVDQLDVPMFTTRPGSVDLVLDGGAVLPGVFEASGLERTLIRIRGLDDVDLERQVGHIRAAFVARGEHDTPTPTRTAAVTAAGGPPGDETLVAMASDLARELERRAIRGPDGSIGWIGLQRDPQTARRLVAPTGDDLYGGTAGIALFFAAIARLTDSAAQAQLSTAILRQAVQRATASDASSPRRGLGIAQGASSLVHALVNAGRLLDDASLIAEAEGIAALITPEQIEADDTLDVFGGSAGAVLALVDLYEETGDRALLERAERGADHLLARRRSDESGLRAWPATDGTLLAGFPHGASGIAHALLRLSAHTEDPGHREAALEGLRWERRTFSPAERDWLPRADVPDGTTVLTRWCQGAPGIALARLSAVRHSEDTALRRDLDIALQTTSSYPWSPLELDGVCCGHAGRVDVLLTAAQALDRPDLAETARASLGDMLAGAAGDRGFRCFGGPAGGFFEPSLFSGVAGIGYVLLRCAAPAELPPLVAFAGDHRSRR